MTGMDKLRLAFDRAATAEILWCAGGRSEPQILACESELGVSLPPSYREFLRRCGNGAVGAVEIFGITDPPSASDPDVAWATTLQRREYGLRPSAVVIGSDGMGGLYVLDTVGLSGAEECPVLVRHALGYEQELASDFGTFVLDLVTERLAQE